MRLLFDEQLSEELCRLLQDVFPGSLHVRQIGAGGLHDVAVWHLAKERDCLLVTKDEDLSCSAKTRQVGRAFLSCSLT